MELYENMDESVSHLRKTGKHPIKCILWRAGIITTFNPSSIETGVGMIKRSAEVYGLYIYM